MIMEILKYALGGFWRFVGFMMISSLASGTIIAIAASIASIFKKK